MDVSMEVHGGPWRSVEVSMRVRGGSIDLHGGPWSSMETSTDLHGDLHGVPDNVGGPTPSCTAPASTFAREERMFGRSGRALPPLLLE